MKYANADTVSSMGDYLNIFPKESKLTTSLFSRVNLLPRILEVLPGLLQKQRETSALCVWAQTPSPLENWAYEIHSIDTLVKREQEHGRTV